MATSWLCLNLENIVIILSKINHVIHSSYYSRDGNLPKSRQIVVAQTPSQNESHSAISLVRFPDSKYARVSSLPENPK